MLDLGEIARFEVILRAVLLGLLWLLAALGISVLAGKKRFHLGHRRIPLSAIPKCLGTDNVLLLKRIRAGP